MIRLFRPWWYQSESGRVSSLHLLRPDALSFKLHEVPTLYLRTCVQPLRKGYLPKASSRVGAQTSLDVKMSTLVLPTARSVATRPEQVLCQTALTPTLSQWIPALIHPHVTLGPCTPVGVQSLKLSEDSDGEPSRHAPSP